MAKSQFMTKMSRSLHKVGFQLKKHSPEILVATGVVGVVTSAVMACKATTKVNDILEDTKEQVEKIHEVANDPQYADRYTEEDSKKDLTIVYAQTGLKLAKLYGPSIILGALSLGCIVTSHGIMRKRNVALTAAYAAVDSSFKKYRGRVIDRFGEELDKELRYNIKTKEVEETVINEDGTESKVKKTIKVADDPTNNSPYSIFFDCGNDGWDPDPELSKFFLIRQQNYANEKLREQGYLFLNDVYEMLGAKITKAGQCVGWIYDEKNPVGDNYVDFGIFDVHKEKSRDFVNGYEQVILLDFNVDGNILDLLK